MKSKTSWTLLMLSGLLSSPGSVTALAGDIPSEALTLYRALTLNVRPEARFRIPMPSQGDLAFSYRFKVGTAKFDKPLSYEFQLEPGSQRVFRHFWDKVYFLDDSYLLVGGEKVPLTCVYVNGQDNRMSKDSPLIPDFVLRVYLVANDYTCSGPINPGWPGNGGRRELWDTYVYYEIRDPTIMLPTEIKLRYRWNEFPGILVDSGGGQ